VTWINLAVMHAGANALSAPTPIGIMTTDNFGDQMFQEIATSGRAA